MKYFSRYMDVASRMLAGRRIAAGLVASIFVLGGIWAIQTSSAATFIASTEAEDGVLVGRAQKLTGQAGASGGGAVRFGAIVISVPPPPLPPGSVLRAFTDNSYWNTPMPANAPIDPQSDNYISDSKSRSGKAHLQLTGAPGTGQAYAQPIYWAKATDKEYAIVGSSPITRVRIPAGASAASGTDGQVVIFDQPNNQVVGIHRASYDAASDTWSTTSNADRWRLNSDGLDNRVATATEPYNFGHRGVPASVRSVRLDEVKDGAINHRLECFWWATFEKSYWPMSGYESGKGGIVPEGIVARIKPSVNIDAKLTNPAAKIIARSLQKYGCMAGDNSGGSNRLKIERNEAEWNRLGITLDSLSNIPWDDWEFIKGGYDPRTGVIR